jgi:hypothetical protein
MSGNPTNMGMGGGRFTNVVSNRLFNDMIMKQNNIQNNLDYRGLIYTDGTSILPNTQRLFDQAPQPWNIRK